jgi:hypothetical protein
MLTPETVNGDAPIALDNRMRTCEPPILIRTICRRVMSLDSGERASFASTSICALVQEPTQPESADVRASTGDESATHAAAVTIAARGERKLKLKPVNRSPRTDTRFGDFRR